MTDSTSVTFTIDGYNFTKSIEDTQKLVRNLDEKIRTARIYKNLPFEDGRLTLDDVDSILRGSALPGEPEEKNHSSTVEAVWYHICRNAESRMFCLHCDGIPQGDHDGVMKDSWEIDIYALMACSSSLLGDERLQRMLRECFDFLLHRLDRILVASR